MRPPRGSGKVKLHTDFTESRTSHDCSEASLLFSIEHEKCAADGANKFAAERAISSREFVQLVDFAATHARRSFLLVLPVHIHQITELAQVAGQQGIPTLHAQLLGEVKIFDHLRVVLFSS